MGILRRLGFASLGLAALLASSPSYAANEDVVRYTARKGDTLIALGRLYLINPENYRIVQRNNRIADPRRIPVGTVIAFPRSLLKFTPAKAKLLSVRGNVLLNVSGARSQASAGQVIGEGAALSTAGSSFVTLALDNGSRVSLPSNSDMRIHRLRTYLLGGSLDYDFDVDKGAARSKVAPLKGGDDSYRMHTPKAVSAVRGTDFEMRYDDVGGVDFAEVDEGGLAVQSGKEQLALPAGNGLAVTPAGLIKEALLPAPIFDSPARLYPDENVAFAVKDDSDRHYFQLSSDAGFVEHIAEARVAAGKVDFGNLPNGNYFVRARAISPNGIQGLPTTYGFKRRLNGIKASAEQDANGYAFKWFGMGEGVRRYHFQLFRGDMTGNPIIDEASLDAPQISISDLPSGEYLWRVGAVQYLDNEASTNWTSPEKLTVGS